MINGRNALIYFKNRVTWLIVYLLRYEINYFISTGERILPYLERRLKMVL